MPLSIFLPRQSVHCICHNSIASYFVILLIAGFADVVASEDCKQQQCHW